MDAAAINSPQLDAQTLAPANRAIKNAAQAWEIVKAFESENSERNKVNARIMQKYNAERPHSQGELEAQGLAWKSNFSTKPLPHLIDKVAPRFSSAIKGMRYLTSAAFPDDVEGAAAKTEVFQKEITKTCRTREGWNDLISEVAQENALFGFTSVSWHDEYCWFPKHYRQDNFFVPRGTKHFAGSAQIYICREEFLLHELFEFLKDPAAAEIAGWNIQNTVDAINSATPDAIRSRNSDVERVYADLSRELTVGSSFTNGARAVVVYSVFVTEIDGKVTHYILADKEGKELFAKEDRFASMADVVAFFSFQHGNGKLHGSKGIGREVYAMAAALDRGRNEVVDRLQMAGKIVVSCDEKDIKRFRMSVLGNAIIIGSAYNISTSRVDGAVEPFLKLDSFITDLLDQIAGSASPKAIEGERVTKAAIELMAGREEERRDSVIERFLSQFVRMMNTVQKRMCSPTCTEQDAQEMQRRLLRHMSQEELDYISNQPAAETVADFSEQERQSIILVAQEGRGNPLYNQKALEHRKISAQLNSEFADSVLLPDNDPTQQAEQTRQQQLENQLLSQGQPVPVSPRDDFGAHLAALEPLVISTAESLVESLEPLPVFETLVAHANEHLQVALSYGADQKALAEPAAKIAAWTKDLANLQAQAEEQAALEQMVANDPIVEAAPTPENIVPML